MLNKAINGARFIVQLVVENGSNRNGNDRTSRETQEPHVFRFCSDDGADGTATKRQLMLSGQKSDATATAGRRCIGISPATGFSL